MFSLQLAYRRAYVGLAVLALVLQALLPLSGALAGQGQWQPICTAVGLKWILVKDTSADDSLARHAQDQAHCPFCLFGELAALAPERDTQALLRVDLRQSCLPAAAPLPYRTHLATPPPSRAPPLQS